MVGGEFIHKHGHFREIHRPWILWPIRLRCLYLHYFCSDFTSQNRDETDYYDDEASFRCTDTRRTATSLGAEGRTQVVALALPIISGVHMHMLPEGWALTTQIFHTVPVVWTN